VRKFFAVASVYFPSAFAQQIELYVRPVETILAFQIQAKEFLAFL
jgi:hypothetical protein